MCCDHVHMLTILVIFASAVLNIIQQTWRVLPCALIWILMKIQRTCLTKDLIWMMVNGGVMDSFLESVAPEPVAR